MRILLCDDHRLFVDSLATVLASRGEEVLIAGTPQEAVATVADSDPDVCVLDVTFPRGSGLDAAGTILENHPRTRVLMLSATEDPAAVAAALEMGVTGWVRKDSPMTNILGAIGRVAQGRKTIEAPVGRASLGPQRGRERERARLLQSLTPREREVLQHLVDAHDTTAIAARLQISQSTARSHVQKVLTKLGVHSRLQAVTLATRGVVE